MKTFYSLIKIALNPSAGDNLSIGLLLQDKNGIRLLFSEDRKRNVKHLLSSNSDIIDFLVKQLESTVNAVNTQLKQQKGKLIEMPILLNSEYFSYLSKYCNGLLQFSTPSFIADDVTPEKFLKLFELLIDKLPADLSKSTSKKDKFNSTIENKLIKRVKDKVHTHVKFDNKIMPSLFFHIEIDCIGLNGAFVGAKSLDFSKSSQTLDTQISHFSNLITYLSLENKKDILKNKFFLIAEEPLKIETPEHKIWDGIQKQTLFKVINPNEVGQVAQIIEDTNAGLFLK